MYPTGMSGSVTFNFIKRPSWFAQGSGGISTPGGDDRVVVDGDRSWDDDKWINGSLLIAHVDADGTVYAPTDSTATAITFTFSGGPTNGIVGYRVAERKTELDGVLADLVELKTAIKLLADDQDAANLALVKSEYRDLLLSAQPLLLKNRAYRPERRRKS